MTDPAREKFDSRVDAEISLMSPDKHVYESRIAIHAAAEEYAAARVTEAWQEGIKQGKFLAKNRHILHLRRILAGWPTDAPEYPYAKSVLEREIYLLLHQPNNTFAATQAKEEAEHE